MCALQLKEKKKKQTEVIPAVFTSQNDTKFMFPNFQREVMKTSCPAQIPNEHTQNFIYNR